MSVPIRQTIVKAGTIGPNELLSPQAGNQNEFRPDCEPGDILNTPFHVDFTTSSKIVDTGTFSSTDPVRVILTAEHPDLPANEHVAAPVGVVLNTSASGFDLHARNSDCAAGKAGFN